MLVQRIKLTLDCKKDRELAEKLEVNKSQITRIKKTGFHGAGTEILINLLLDKIEKGNQ